MKRKKTAGTIKAVPQTEGLSGGEPAFSPIKSLKLADFFCG